MLAAGTASPLQASLASFVQEPDPAYKYDVGASWSEGDVTFTNLSLTSQSFHGTVWHHVLTVAWPKTLKTLDQAILVVGGGRNDQLPPFSAPHGQTGATQLATLSYLASHGSIIAAMVEQVPDQPLFGGKIEDEIVSYTIGQFFHSSDDSWPLLQPMVKSTVRAMDAIQDFTAKTSGHQVTGFTITGESKRGWTTYLTAAIDKRVNSIVPMVFDMLNIPAQLTHQLATWGAYSEQLGDYGSLAALMATPRGRELLRIIDPISYKDVLTQPKVIILGTNDRYWPVDAATLYFPALPGPKYLLYLANASHETAGHRETQDARIALALAAAGALTIPAVTSTFMVDAHSGQALLTLTSEVKPTALTHYQAKAKSQDFRSAIWQKVGVVDPDKTATVKVSPQPGFYSANFLSAEYSLAGHPITLSSSIGIVPPVSVTHSAQ